MQARCVNRLLTLSFLIMCTTLIMPPPPSEAGLITGKVMFEGTAPPMPRIDVNSDPYCVLQHSSNPLTKESVIVDATGGLKNVFVYVKSGEELTAMIENEEIETPTEPVVLDQKDCHYVPHVFGVMVGQPIEIRNSDETLHNVHAMPTKGGAFNLGMPGKPEPWGLSKSFKSPEVMVPIKCDVHSWMESYAGVLEHPFYSVTNEQGSFEIKDLPAGEYVIEAWHEKLGTSEQTVTISDDAPLQVSFTFTPPKKA